MHKGYFRGPVAGGLFYRSASKITSYLFDEANFGQNEDKYSLHVKQAKEIDEQTRVAFRDKIKGYEEASMPQELNSRPEISCTVVETDIAGSYRGGCKDGKASGLGIATGLDLYVGEFSEGKPDGRGSYYWHDSLEFYRGGWVAGKRAGKGIYIWTNGNRYEGDFAEDARTGKGVYIYSNGDKYEGEFKDNEMDGQGRLTWSSGDIYEGMFVKGSRTGKGLLRWADGDRYEGDFVDNKRTGKGIFTWANGYRYEGAYLNNKRVLIEQDQYLAIAEPFIQEWVLTHLVNDTDVTPGKWYSTNNGKLFISNGFSELFPNGQKIMNPTWSGDNKNGYANGFGTLSFEVLFFKNRPMNITCYMVNGSMLGMVTFDRASQSFMMQSKAVAYVGNNKLMEEDEYTDFIRTRYDMGLASARAKDTRFLIRYAFKQGTIGTRYVPVTTNQIYNTETLFNIGNTPVTKSTSYTETQGGVDEKVAGYTAVIGITNKTDDYYIVKTIVGGTFANSEYFKEHFFLWFGKESANLKQKLEYLTMSKDYLLRPREEMKDQIIVGEKEPKDFQIGFADIVKVDGNWVSALDNTLKIAINKCVNAREFIHAADSFLSDPKASAWHKELKGKRQSAISYIDRFNEDLLRKKVDTSFRLPASYDKDFDNDVEITVKNTSAYPLKITIKDPVQQQRVVNVPSKSTNTIASKARTVDKKEIAVNVESIQLLDAEGTEKSFDVCLDEQVQPQQRSAKEVATKHGIKNKKQ